MIIRKLRREARYCREKCRGANKSGKEGPDNNDNSTKIALTGNVSPKKDRRTNLVEKATKFHGRKYLRRYNFKIKLEETQEIPGVYLAQ